MSVYEIVGVSLPERTPEPLIGSNIDLPKAGATGDVFTLHIVGWVLGRNSPATAVEVVYQPEPDLVRPGPDRVIRITPIRGDRTDVAAAYPQVPADVDCHFEALVGVVGLTPEFELRLMAVLEDRTRVQIGSLRVRHQPLRTAFQPTLQPIIVTCLGRTGTTWLMRMLASHPEVVVYRRFPYESSTAKYWMHMLKVLAEPSNMVQSTHPDTFHNDIWHVGHNPFYDDAIAARRRARPLVRPRVRRAPGDLLPAEHRGLVHDRRRDAGPERRALLRREAPVAQLHPGADARAVPGRQGGLPGARLPRHGALDPGLRPQARAGPASVAATAAATSSTARRC